ncbi:MAG TPA: helix-turn-helix transcriptional regulator [Opitutaceae bacterium]
MPRRSPALRFPERLLARVQGFLLELHGATDAEQLRRQIPAGLATLIASDRTSFNEAEIGRAHRRVVPEPIPAYWRRLWPVYAAHAHEHPFLDPEHEPPACQVVTFRDLPPAWRRATLYHDYFLAVGARHQLCAHLCRQGAVRFNVNFNRSSRDFTDAERGLLELLSPHIARAWRNVVTVSSLRRHAPPPPDATERQHVAIVERRRGTIVWLSNQAGDALHAYFGPGVSEGAPLPAGVRRWLESRREALATCEALLAPPVPFIARSPAGQLRVRLAHACHTTAVLILEEQRTAPAGGRPAPTSLTRRENEILDWVSEGKRNGEIALILGISARTVEKHLEHVFEKLGVETRTAAIREALARRRNPPA